MKKLHNTIFALSLLFLNVPSQAAIIGGVQGNAASWVESGCNSCCYVENKSQKRIRATLSLALGASVTEIVFPKAKKAFILDGKCLTSAFALVVNFIPDDQ